jgi:hypothetical protein
VRPRRNVSGIEATDSVQKGQAGTRALSFSRGGPDIFGDFLKGKAFLSEIGNGLL